MDLANLYNALQTSITEAQAVAQQIDTLLGADDLEGAQALSADFDKAEAKVVSFELCAVLLECLPGCRRGGACHSVLCSASGISLSSSLLLISYLVRQLSALKPATEPVVRA